MFCLAQVFAQNTYTGLVTDLAGTPLSNATILIEDSSNGVLTNFDGEFSITANHGEIIVVSYIGFTTKAIELTDQLNITIVLEEEISLLDDVVVVGYGTQKKQILTSSVSVVKGKDLSREPVVNPTQALQGKAAGVQVVASDAPGQSSTVIIRGLGTIQGGRNPLYVVDGLLTNNLNNINTSDIESVSVLKDAASLAIYGNRGANGVIIVTTKKGEKGKTTLTVDNYLGVKRISFSPQMANSSSFVTYSNEAALRDLLMDSNPSNDNSTANFFPTDQMYSTNWLDEISQLGTVSNHNISVSGGSENIQTFLSASFNREEAVLKGNDFNRFTFRSNISYKINDRTNVSNNVSVQLASLTPKPYSSFTSAYKQAPIVAVKDENGRYGSSIAFNNVSNPVAQIELHDEEQNFFKLQAAFTLDYKLVDPLTFTSRLSAESERGRFYYFDNRLEQHLARDPSNTEANFQPSDPESPENPETILSVTHTRNYRWFLDNYFTFEDTFIDDHTIKLTVGITAEERGGEFLSGTRQNVPKDSNLKFNISLGDENNTQQSSGSFEVLNRLYSYIGRLNYDYKKKYLFNSSYRRDSSSNFQKGFRHGHFYAFSLGWLISNEDFLENSSFNKLKLRASYGELGNQDVRFNVLTAQTGSGGFYPFGPNQDLQQGITVTKIVQEDLTWEKTNEFNLGLEFSLNDINLEGEVEVYRRVNENATLQLELPKNLGFEPFNSHVAEIENKGIETSIGWNNEMSKSLSVDVSAVFSYNINELTKISSPFFKEQTGGSINNGQYTKKVAVGQPLGSFYLYEVEGIDDRGELVYRDLNEDGLVNEEDRNFFGSYIPKYNLAFNLGINYKKFDFTLAAYGSFGNKIYNGKKAQRFGNENIEQDVFNNRWTSGRASNTIPIASNAVPLSSTYFLESGDFFRINSLSLGYTFENTASFSSIRIYASAKNPIILKRFSGFTPELPGDPLGRAGIELDAYPTLQSYFIGVNASL